MSFENPITTVFPISDKAPIVCATGALGFLPPLQAEVSVSLLPRPHLGAGAAALTSYQPRNIARF